MTSWSFSDDLPGFAVVGVLIAVALASGLLVLEVRRRERYGALIVGSGVCGMVLLGAATLRPAVIETRGSSVGAKVVILVDQSRRLLLPEGRGTRRDVALAAVGSLTRRLEAARPAVLGFGSGAARPYDVESPSSFGATSDLLDALDGLAASWEERPKAVVVISDGRLTRPTEGSLDGVTERSLARLGVPIHTVAVSRRAPADATVRAVRAAGAAVAHQPLPITVELGCTGLDCSDVPVTVHELRQNVEPALLASGIARFDGDTAKLDLTITLDRAGARIVRVAIEAPRGDELPRNDERILPFLVARDRVRVLHVAGRPTYDVRALRRWLKNDGSIDLVAFFILRTEADDTNTTSDDELALIPFPVDELFEEHLASFDAVVLQDIDAVTYKLAAHLGRLARYVEGGGGLVLVGGPAAFSGGNYGGTPIERVLPIALEEGGAPFDTVEVEPRYTEAGRAAPVTRALRDLLGDRLPSMMGSNTLGPAKQGAIVLWEHPTRRAGDAAMPLLALAESGDGRSIALGLDGTHRLAFGELAAGVGGRAHGALWDGLVGWLMRDPRFEAVRMEIVGECVAGEPVEIALHRLPQMEGAVTAELSRLGASAAPAAPVETLARDDGSSLLRIGRLDAGGYTVRAQVGAAPPTRFDFACEHGGEAFSDPRPDPARLRTIADATGGVAVHAADVDDIPEPAATEIAAERHVAPLLPPWVWTLSAAVVLGAHWVFRRRGGLA